jgi:putative oxygen-independent coproporphyrinogen III oxidase
MPAPPGDAIDPGARVAPGHAVPLSLYVHYPWCLRKCPYCDFNSHQRVDDRDDERYLQALLSDVEQQLSAVPGRPLETVFIGGGTPSLMAGGRVQILLDDLRQRGRLAADAEISLEANPGAVDAHHFAGYRQAGVNRLSIGVQSFDDESLVRIGRIHDRRAAVAAVQLARDAGFDNLNLDMMFGLPGHDMSAALADLQTAIDLGPQHLSWYQLTLEPNTPFHHSPPRLPGEDALAEMQWAGQERLAAAGFVQYEVSAYARPGHQCRHNLNYWHFGDYLGIGAGAHAKLSWPDRGVLRYARARSPQRYLADPGGDSSRRWLTAAELPLEFMLNALRLRQGFSPSLFAQRTGLPLRFIEAPLAQAMQRGLLLQEGGRMVPSEVGWRFLNDLMGYFVP